MNSMKPSALALLALSGSAGGISCSSSTRVAATSDVKLAVVAPSNSRVNSFTFQVQSSSGATLIGPASSDISAPQATAALDIYVPVTPTNDPGDTITLNATTTDTNEACSGTSAPFPVVAGSSSSVVVTLSCGTATAATDTGNVAVTATTVEGDNCPSITGGVVAPDETSTGGSVSVMATASDADLNETLTYAWTPAANFLDPAAASTDYVCTPAGTNLITVTVTDSHQPPCSATASFTVVCVGP